MKNLYSILNLKDLSTSSEVKRSFIALAKIYHPDIDPTKEEQFKEILDAYKVLSNDKTKKTYDAQLKNKGNIKKYIINISIKESLSGIDKTIIIDNEEIKLSLSGGIINGSKIRLIDHDITLIINIVGTKTFKVKGTYLITPIRIDYIDAVVGSTIVMGGFMPNELITFTVPKYTVSGDVIISNENYGLIGKNGKRSIIKGKIILVHSKLNEDISSMIKYIKNYE